MKIRVRIAAPMAGDHGTHAAESIVTLPEHVARQVVLNAHGHLVDDQGRPIPHDFEPDPAEPTSAEAAELVAVAAPGRPKKKPAKPAREAAAEATPTPAEAGPDLSEWTAEE